MSGEISTLPCRPLLLITVGSTRLSFGAAA